MVEYVPLTLTKTRGVGVNDYHFHKALQNFPTKLFSAYSAQRGRIYYWTTWQLANDRIIMAKMTKAEGTSKEPLAKKLKDQMLEDKMAKENWERTKWT